MGGMMSSMYAKVDSGVVVEVGFRPTWHVDGEPASDEVYRAGGFQVDENGEPIVDGSGNYILATDKPGWFPIQYSEPEHDEFLQSVVLKEHSEWIVEETVVCATYTIVDVPLAEAVAAARQDAHDRINSQYESRTKMLAAGYPEDEQKSWPVQIQEASIVLSGGTDPTPWIDAASVQRGISRSDLAALIIAQDNAYRMYHGALTGIRQRLRNDIDDVPEDEDAVSALMLIDWPAD